MVLVATLDLRLQPADLEGAMQTLTEVLKDTRAFEGCLGLEVLVDDADPTHVLVVEHWESPERDAAYRAWRAGQSGSPLAPVLAGPPTLQKFSLGTQL